MMSRLRMGLVAVVALAVAGSLATWRLRAEDKPPPPACEADEGRPYRKIPELSECDLTSHLATGSPAEQVYVSLQMAWRPAGRRRR